MSAKTAQKDEKRIAWNKGIEVGQRAPFTAQEVKRIKAALVKRGDRGLHGPEVRLTIFFALKGRL